MGGACTYMGHACTCTYTYMHMHKTYVHVYVHVYGTYMYIYTCTGHCVRTHVGEMNITCVQHVCTYTRVWYMYMYLLEVIKQHTCMSVISKLVT